jgi:hypothetical protein
MQCRLTSGTARLDKCIMLIIIILMLPLFISRFFSFSCRYYTYMYKPDSWYTAYQWLPYGWIQQSTRCRCNTAEAASRLIKPALEFLNNCLHDSLFLYAYYTITKQSTLRYRRNTIGGATYSIHNIGVNGRRRVLVAKLMQRWCHRVVMKYNSQCRRAQILLFQFVSRDHRNKHNDMLAP